GASVGYQQVRRVVEVARVRNNDAVAGGEPVQDFYLTDRSGTELYRRAHRMVATHHIKGSRRFIDRRAAIELQDAIALIQHNSHGRALVLPQPWRLSATEADAPRHLVLTDLRRDRRHDSGLHAAIQGYLCRHARLDIAGVGLGHLELQLERGQVHDG